MSDKPTYEELEQRVKELEAQLQHACKMVNIGTLSGGIAHNFNNILGIIIGNTEIAMMDIPKWNSAHHNLSEIQKACLQARDVVKQILAFSRQSQQEMKPVKISPIIKDSIKLLRSSIPTTIEIRQNISSKSDTINADPTQIYQILLNLCTNAAHAMRENGGILEVSLENNKLDEEDAARYNDLPPGDYLRLTVSDTGHGIEPDILDRIFDQYFTTKDVDEETGMGLAVINGIVRNHNGEITVYSKPGKGATFHVYFPLAEEEIVEETDTEESVPTGIECILFIDDEKALVNLGRQILGRLGYSVISRTSSSEALELFRKNPNQFDVIVTDMTMPNMTGIDLAKKLMKIRSDIPIILCTGFNEKIDEAKAMEMGISAFVMKPIIMRDIANKIREVLNKK